MNTVIRSPNWIGDGIMCLPAIRAYKTFFPNDRLTVVVKRYLADVFLNMPEIDEIMQIPDRWTPREYLRHLRRLRQKRFGRGILFTNSFASALFFRLAGVGSLCGYARDGRGWLLHDKVPGVRNDGHHQFHYLKIIEHVAQKKIATSFPANLALAAEEKYMARALLSGLGISSGNDRVAIAPAAAYGSAKAWLPERFAEVIGALLAAYPAIEILLLGGPSEKEKIETITAGLNGRAHNLAGRLSLRQTIILLSACRLLICNDSGLMHIAASLKIPLLAIFGPTVVHGSAPLAETYRLLYHGADCAPCRHRECPTDHRCMTAVTCAEVLAAARDLLGLPEPSPE